MGYISEVIAFKKSANEQDHIVDLWYESLSCRQVISLGRLRFHYL